MTENVAGSDTECVTESLTERMTESVTECVAGRDPLHRSEIESQLSHISDIFGNFLH